MKKKTLIGFTAIIGIAVIAFFAYEAKATLAPVPTAPMVSSSSLLTGHQDVKADAAPVQVLRENTLIDHKAHVFQVSGSANLLKKGTDRWRSLRVGSTIGVGDQIRTSKDSIVRIHYDDYYLNTVQINPNSLAEFQSIEPTQIYITNGEVFSVLDGLPKGSSYQVVTPTAVGGVRGTRFLRAFNSVTQQDRTMVSEGTVEVTLLNKLYDSKSFSVTEQKSLTFDKHTMSDFSEAAIRPLQVTYSGELNKDFLAMKAALASMKGEDELMKAAEMWEEVQGNQNKVVQLQKQLSAVGISQNVTPEGVIVFSAPMGSTKAEQKKEAAKEVHAGSNTDVNVTPEGGVAALLSSGTEAANNVANLNNTFLTSEVDICKQNPSACGK